MPDMAVSFTGPASPEQAKLLDRIRDLVRRKRFIIRTE
jgi:hypothetical protein